MTIRVRCPLGASSTNSLAGQGKSRMACVPGPSEPRELLEHCPVALLLVAVPLKLGWSSKRLVPLVHGQVARVSSSRRKGFPPICSLRRPGSLTRVSMARLARSSSDSVGVRGSSVSCVAALDAIDLPNAPGRADALEARI